MITLIYGIGSRVKNISLELTNEKSEVVAWTVNKDCPVGHREIFPNGIEGLEIVDVPCRRLVASMGNLHHRKEILPETVNRVFAAMELPAQERHEIGIILRAHFWKTKPLADYLSEIKTAAASTSGKIPTLCGSHRREVMEILGERGIAQSTSEMEHDLDRSANEQRQFLLEWWRVLNCEKILSNTMQTALLWPHNFLLANYNQKHNLSAWL